MFLKDFLKKGKLKKRKKEKRKGFTKKKGEILAKGTTPSSCSRIRRSERSTADLTLIIYAAPDAFKPAIIIFFNFFTAGFFKRNLTESNLWDESLKKHEKRVSFLTGNRIDNL